MRSALVRTDRYTGVAIAFHWTIAALVLINLWLGLFHDSLPREWQVIPVHKSIGLTVLVLTLGRIAWRVTHPAPPLPSGTPRWERIVAQATHYVFYALLLILPMTGWVMSSASAKRWPIDWFGLFPVPYLPVPLAAGGPAHGAHETLGLLMLALVVLHVGAALRHHFIRHDTVLGRMLPIFAPRRPAEP